MCVKINASITDVKGYSNSLSEKEDAMNLLHSLTICLVISISLRKLWNFEDKSTIKSQPVINEEIVFFFNLKRILFYVQYFT